MLVPIIISLWFAYLANKCGKGVLEWALGSAFGSFTLNTLLIYLADALFADAMAGSPEFAGYFVIRLTPAFLTIITMVIIGKIFLASKIPEVTTADDDAAAETVEEQIQDEGKA